MKVFIEEYRGFEITFDTKNETFSAWSDSFDDEFNKKSFTAVKKGVDDYIKENATFKPFKIQRVFSYGGKISKIEDPLLVVGITKDKRLVVQLGDKKKQLSDYDAKDFILYNPENDNVKKDYDELIKHRNKVIDEFKTKEKEIFERVVVLKTVPEKIEELSSYLNL